MERLIPLASKQLEGGAGRTRRFVVVASGGGADTPEGLFDTAFGEGGLVAGGEGFGEDCRQERRVSGGLMEGKKGRETSTPTVASGREMEEMCQRGRVEEEDGPEMRIVMFPIPKIAQTTKNALPASVLGARLP
jgi:hypothetical protein